MGTSVSELYGRMFYEAQYAGGLWGVYQMLGKLFNYVQVLRKPEP